MNYLINGSKYFLLTALVCFIHTGAHAANLLHHWSFDEGSGSAVADTVGNADMSVVTGSSGWTSGKVNGAFALNGSNYILSNANDQVTNPSTGVAIAGWFQTTGNVDRDYIYEIEREFGMRIRNSSLQTSFNGNTSGAPRYGENVDDGLWHHFVAQNNGTTTQIYLDGQLIGSFTESLGTLTSESRPSAIGARYSGARPMLAIFDDFRYYDAVLTLSEIEALAQISNRPPVAVNDSYSDAQNTLLMIAAPGVLGNDTELDGDSLTASLVAGVGVGNGTLNLSSDGSFSYDPPTDFSGIVTFTYQAVDQDGSSNTATVTLTILDPSASLTVEEVAQIETDLGITLTAQEKLDLASLVKPQSTPAWRTSAESRIETHRKANLTVEVVDSQLNPIPGATVRMELKNHAFKFGGVLTVMDLTDASNNLSDNGSTIADWERLTKALFNSVGLNNGFKPRIVGQHQYLPNFLTWASNNNLPVRGHLLIWPGTGDVDDMDVPGAVSGVDYGRHLTESTSSAFATKNVRGAVETYKASARTQADKDALKAVVDSEIVEWASQWDVFEWDVINETLSNRLLMDILGYDQMAHWFHLAKQNMPNPETTLFINEFQLPSARFTGTVYETRKATYFSRIDQLLTPPAPLDPSGTQVLPAPVDGVGFQSRFRFLDGYDPAVVYNRLEEFATRYPTLELIGTEFELKDDYNWLTGDLIQAYDEATRAQVTEEVLTTYFSHDQVTGMNAWDVFNDQPDGTDTAYTRSMFYYGDGPGGVDGPIVKLNALVWYYLHRIRYHSDVNDTTEANGQTILRGFKGEHLLTVTYDGNDYVSTQTVLADGSIQVQLNDVSVTSTEKTLEHWPFDDVVSTELSAATNVSGSAAFLGSAGTLLTDGNGALVASQDASKTSGGTFLGSSAITIGSRSTGVYELEFVLNTVHLTGGDASGASIGVGLNDSANGGDLFRVRINKTGAGLALNTFFDSGAGNAYTGLHTFNSIYELTDPLKVRVVVDLDDNTADIYMTEGMGAETLEGQVALRSDAVWDQLSFVAVNNSTDWGVSDVVEMDYLKITKLEVDNYDLWETRTNWGGETLTARTDDPDGDQLVNLLEFALGGDPVVDDAITLLPIVVGTATPQLQFTLGVDSTELNFRLQHSEDLSDWSTLPETVVHGESGETVQVPLLQGAFDTLFSRLAVSED